MKKTLLLALLITLLTLTSAHAYFVEFDQYGSGVDANLFEMDEWSFSGVNEYNADAGTLGVAFSYEDLAGNFTEDFTMRIDEGHNTGLESGSGYLIDFDPDLYADVHLKGNSYTVGTESFVDFTSGSIQVYGDIGTPNRDYDFGTDSDIATLTLTGSLLSQFQGSLIDGDLSVPVDLSFTFDTVNAAFWGDTEEYMATQGFLLSVVAGRMNQDSEGPWFRDGGVWSETPSLGMDKLLIEWATTDFNAEFNVPEPGSLLLLGFGLLGLVGYTRKRKMRRM